MAAGASTDVKRNRAAIDDANIIGAAPKASALIAAKASLNAPASRRIEALK